MKKRLFIGNAIRANLALALGLTLLAPAANAATVPDCWKFDPNNNGKYSLTIPLDSTVSPQDVIDYLGSKKIFTVTENRYSRSLRGIVIEFFSSAERVGPLLLQKMAETDLARLPKEIQISCNPVLNGESFAGSLPIYREVKGPQANEMMGLLKSPGLQENSSEGVLKARAIVVARQSVLRFSDENGARYDSKDGEAFLRLVQPLGFRLSSDASSATILKLDAITCFVSESRCVLVQIPALSTIPRPPHIMPGGNIRFEPFK